MPTYEYECEKCGKRFEIKRGFHEEGEAYCPKCKTKGRQVFSPTPIIFKGSGFYVTDHRKKESSDTGEPAKAEPKKPSGKFETADTKPTTAPDSLPKKAEPTKPQKTGTD